LELAIELANRSPSDPRTLTRAARDFMNKNPAFALEAGLAALRWLARAGLRLRGHQRRCVDDLFAYDAAGRALGRRDEIRTRVRELAVNGGFVAAVLGRELGPGGQPGTSKNHKRERTERPHPVIYLYY
jgi:hypothetical protein